MNLTDLVKDLPEPKVIDSARSTIRKALKESGKRLVVVDDDPTGTQTVHGVMVYIDWSLKEMRKVLNSEDSVFYVSTNSRSLDSKQASTLNHELGRNLSESCHLENAQVLLASRSDSTLRGHFPDEVYALASGYGLKFDGIIVVPAFFEAGRYTVRDVHWVEQGGKVVSAEQTEFAQDPIFGYKHGNLKSWIEEKTKGKVRTDNVQSISLKTIRSGGPEAVTELLIKVNNGGVVIVNATCYYDLEVFVLGLLDAEDQGKKFMYRCAASFVKVRGGFEDKPFLTHEELKPEKNNGLIVVGSYVDRTTRQLKSLLESQLVKGIELRVDKLINPEERVDEIRHVVQFVDEVLSQGETVMVYTSRTKQITEGRDFLEFGSIIMSSLCDVVKGLRRPPGFLVAKGGITSVKVAESALGVRKAFVLGQIANGVPVWRLDSESRLPGIPYVVFPGNVGDDMTLVDVMRILQKKKGEEK